MLQKLTEWLKDLKTMADNDEDILISWFGETKNEPICIIGGWSDGFSADYADLLHTSESSPTYAMCVKIAINEGECAYTDFDLMNMPIDKETNEVDDTCIALERDDDPAELALFLVSEWDRISKEYKENIK